MEAPKRGLRAVGDDERAVPTVPMTIEEAAEAGNRLEELRSMRRRIAKALDDTGTAARDLASLSRRQIELGREIEAIEAQNAKEAGQHAAVSDGAFDAAAI